VPSARRHGCVSYLFAGQSRRVHRWKNTKEVEKLKVKDRSQGKGLTQRAQRHGEHREEESEIGTEKRKIETKLGALRVD